MAQPIAKVLTTNFVGHILLEFEPHIRGKLNDLDNKNGVCDKNVGECG